MLNQTIKNFED